jgi:hypothetical protein
MEIVSLETQPRIRLRNALLSFALLLAGLRSSAADSIETAKDVLQFGIPALALGMSGYRRDLAGAGQFAA